EKRDDFQIGTHFLAWAMTIARFELLRYRRHAARDTVVRFSDELELLMIAEVSERSQRDVARRHDALQGCLQQLNEPHRRLLMARYATQKSLTDFAAEFGRSAGSLKVTLHRLRTRLADCIQRRLSTEDA
ncbi:MAG: sigma-70 family RNA polymerase sigma factor, partial [Planctomycetota bacterium]